MGSEKSAKASLISASSCAVMSCSFASLDCLAFVPAPNAPDSAAPPDLRFAGCYMVRKEGTTMFRPHLMRKKKTKKKKRI